MSTGRALLTVFCVVALLALAILVIYNLATGDERNAKNACTAAINDQLKAPSTARFDYTVVDGDGHGNFTIVGTVDAQNSFGALIRSSVHCEVVNGSITEALLT